MTVVYWKLWCALFGAGRSCWSISGTGVCCWRASYGSGTWRGTPRCTWPPCWAARTSETSSLSTTSGRSWSSRTRRARRPFTWPPDMVIGPLWSSSYRWTRSQTRYSCWRPRQAASATDLAVENFFGIHVCNSYDVLGEILKIKNYFNDWLGSKKITATYFY